MSSYQETRPLPILSPRPAPYWSSCGHRNLAVAWTSALTPLLRPPRRSAPLAPPVRSMTDEAPGGSPDPRPGWGRRAELEIGRGGKSARSARRKETLTGWRSPGPSTIPGLYTHLTLPAATRESYLSFLIPSALPLPEPVPALSRPLPPVSPSAR